MDETSSYINGDNFATDRIRIPDGTVRSLFTTPTAVFRLTTQPLVDRKYQNNFTFITSRVIIESA